MGDNQNARLAQAIGRLLNQKDRSTLSTVLEDIFPVYLLDSLSAPENAYQQSRDWWFLRSIGSTGAAGDNAGTCLLNGSPGSLVVVEEVYAWAIVASTVFISTGGLFPGSAQGAGVGWGDERNGGAGPPAVQAWTTTTAGAPTGTVIPLIANTLTKLPFTPFVMRNSNPSSNALRFSAGVNATFLGICARGYERPWEPSDA